MKIRKKGLLTIKGEIFLLSFLFLAIVALIFSGIFLCILYRNNMDNAKNSLRECNSQIVTYTEGMFHENATMLGILSRDMTVINSGFGNPEAVLTIYNAILEEDADITYIYSGYEDGRLLISDYEIPAGFNLTERPWYHAAKVSDGVARVVYSDAATGEWLFSQSRKLIDSNGSMVGVVAIDCSRENISKQLSTKYRFNSQRSFIIDSKGMVLIHPEEKHINEFLLDYMDSKAWASIAHGTGNYGEYEKDGVRAMAYFERIPQTDFMVVTAIDASEVTQPIIRSVKLFIRFLVCISIVLGFVLSRILLYRFARPVMALKSRIEKVAGGCSEETPEINFSNAEINDIADGIEIIVKDIAQQEEQRKAAEYLSYHDSMTGLYNRRFLAEEQRRLDEKDNYPLCIICCDVNGLKLVNDVFGHNTGDRLICRVAECLAEECGTEDVLFRVGGDEFIMLMPHTSDANAEETISRIKTGFFKENICGAMVSASLGYGIKESGEEPFDKAIQRADKMMYRQKLVESGEMKRQTVGNIIEAAKEELLVRELTKEEEYVLKQLAMELCPEMEALLKQSYRLRNVGMCTLFQTGGKGSGMNSRHTENGYRLLSTVDEYRGMAVYVLHYTEHWDGSGWPAGLAGRDIPLISRILAVVDAYFMRGEDGGELEREESWYDPKIMSVLSGLLK